MYDSDDDCSDNSCVLEDDKAPMSEGHDDKALMSKGHDDKAPMSNRHDDG